MGLDIIAMVHQISCLPIEPNGLNLLPKILRFIYQLCIETHGTNSVDNTISRGVTSTRPKLGDECLPLSRTDE